MVCTDLSQKFCTKQECQELANKVNYLQQQINSLTIRLNNHESSQICNNAHGGIKKCLPVLDKGLKGKDGKDGKDGKSPKLFVTRFSGGVKVNSSDGYQGIVYDGEQGKDGKNGKDGKDGKTPTAKVVRNGNCAEITVGYYKSIVCDGKEGKQGRNGINGLNGKDGKPGKDGINGFNGLNGKDGNPGKDGINGLNGKDGKNGKDAIDNIPYINNKITQLKQEIINMINNSKCDLKGVETKLDKLLQCACKTPKDYTALLNQLISLSNEIKNKVTIDATILNGNCVAPENDGQWYEYQEGLSVNALNFSTAFTTLSSQLKLIHEDTCKAVQPLIQLPEDRNPYVCDVDANGDPEVKLMEIKEGFVPPWWLNPVVGTGTNAIASWVVSKLLNSFWDYQQEQDKNLLTGICELDNGCGVVLADPSAVWKNTGNLILFYWKLETRNTRTEKIWSSSSQLFDPIDELMTEDEVILWNKYFANMYQIVGKQYGSLWEDKGASRNQLYKGFFHNVDEGKRFFEHIKLLTKRNPRTNNNPIFPVSENKSINIVNEGKKMILRKVCICNMSGNTDEIRLIREIKKPK